MKIAVFYAKKVRIFKYQKQNFSLVPVLDDSVCRVRTHAGAALVNFIDDAPKEVIMPYLQPLCEKLSLVLQQHLQATGPFMVLEQLCTTVAAVADKVETDFRQQYARFIPNLRTLLQVRVLKI